MNGSKRKVIFPAIFKFYPFTRIFQALEWIPRVAKSKRETPEAEPLRTIRPVREKRAAKLWRTSPPIEPVNSDTGCKDLPPFLNRNAAESLAIKSRMKTWISKMRLGNKVIALSILFGLLMYFVDTLVNYFFLCCGTFWGMLISVQSDEVYGRAITLASFLGFGLVLSRVLSKLQQAQKVLAERTEELAAQNAELDEFTYIASHDLQEPLRIVTTFSELLGKDLGNSLPEQAAKDLHFITDGAKRMQTLIRDLLLLSRAGRADMKKKKVSLAKCAVQALEALTVRVQETQAEIIRDDLRCVTGDETLLTQLYQNLIGNALKFTADQPPIIHLTAQEIDGQMIFGVKDNGIGIDPKYAEQIFRPFSRLQNQAQCEGSGIGLATCRKIVERHGGKIWVESELGKGAHFRFTMGHRRKVHGSSKKKDRQLSFSLKMSQMPRS